MKNKEKTIPVKIIVVLDNSLSTLLANNKTIIIVNKLHKNPTRDKEKFPRNGIVIPETIKRPTPSDAPDDTPKVYGEANGFFNTDWTTAPLTAKAPPTQKANKTLGNLILHIIETSFASIPSNRLVLNNLC